MKEANGKLERPTCSTEVKCSRQAQGGGAEIVVRSGPGDERMVKSHLKKVDVKIFHCHFHFYQK